MRERAFKTYLLKSVLLLLKQEIYNVKLMDFLVVLRLEFFYELFKTVVLKVWSFTQQHWHQIWRGGGVPVWLSSLSLHLWHRS